MIKNHNQFILFLYITSFLGVISSFGVKKILSVLLYPTVYYCQSFIHSFSTKIPTQLVIFLFSVALFFLLSIVAKIIWQARKIVLYRKNLLRHRTTKKNVVPLLQGLLIENSTILIDSTYSFAYCIGIRNPKIYFSTALVSLLNVQELEAVLLHEKHHIDQKDTVTMFIATILQSLFFFFPVLSDLLFTYRVEQEIKADESAIEMCGSAHFLMSALKKLISFPTAPLLVYSAVADEATLEARIHRLGGKKYHVQIMHKCHVVISLFSFLVLVGLVVMPIQLQAMTIQNKHAMMVCLSGDACAIWCKKHDAIIPYSPTQPMSKNFSSH